MWYMLAAVFGLWFMGFGTAWHDWLLVGIATALFTVATALCAIEERRTDKYLFLCVMSFGAVFWGAFARAIWPLVGTIVLCIGLGLFLGYWFARKHTVQLRKSQKD